MQKSNPLEHQVIEDPQPKTFEWVNAPSMAQQAKAPEADDVETAQDEENQENVF